MPDDSILRPDSSATTTTTPNAPLVPVVIGAGAGPKTFEWIARHAAGWMTTPTSTEVAANADRLRKAWADAGRDGSPDIRGLVAKRPTEEDFADWMAAGASELIWGVPDSDKDKVLAYLDKMAGRLGLSGA